MAEAAAEAAAPARLQLARRPISDLLGRQPMTGRHFLIDRLAPPTPPKRGGA
jgi:hypothetical protein